MTKTQDSRTGQGVDRVIGALAGRQHGVVSLAQLRELGFSSRGVERRLRRGSLLALHRGVYAVGHESLTIRGRWLAAVLASGPDAVLSHRSAGQLWGLARASPSPFEVTRPRSFRPRPGIRCHQHVLPPDEVEEVEGIPVTSVSRTLLDLATILNRSRLERALNEAEVLRLTSAISIPDLLERYPRRRGSALLRALLLEIDADRGVTRNQLEERFAALVRAHGLPRPRRNAAIAVRGRFFEADCLWREQRLIVELDGRAVHGTRRAFESDRERDRLLIAAGWRIMRVTWRQLNTQGAEIAADLRRALNLGR